jgi:molybdopterin-biosynthesis enzyme MoeA-like protein
LADITYESLAAAFAQPLAPHAETLRRLDAASTARRGPQVRTPAQQAAFARMALLPARAEVLFVCEELGVPVVRLDGRLCVLPGVPHLFERLLDGLAAYLPLPPASERPLRIQVFTS